MARCKRGGSEEALCECVCVRKVDEEVELSSCSRFG